MGGKVKDIVKGAAVVAAVATGVGFITGAVSLASGVGAVAAYAGRQFLTSAVLGAVSSALAKKPSFPTASELSGRTISRRDPIATRKIVYGEARVGGTVVFMEASNNNADLHQVVVLAAHEVNSIKNVQFGDQVVASTTADNAQSSMLTTTPNYSSKSAIWAKYGSTGQASLSALASQTSVDTNFRLRGNAYLYVRMTYDQDIFANGAPNVSATVQGRKVYDPRTDTTTYSNNAALCIRDYLTDSTYGLGATADEIDEDSFEAAADICDENVSLSGGGTEKRYTINGVIDTGNSPNDILEQMLTACAGSLFYSNGKWHIKAGAYVAPTDTLTLDDLRGPIQVSTRNSGQSQFNAVKGIFVSPDNNWQPTDFPEITSSTFETEDGGERKYADYTLPFTTSASMAQRIAKQALYRNREQITVTMPCKLTAFKYQVGDTLQVTNERFGWTNKVFEVVSWNLAPEITADGSTLGVDLVLKETSSTIYAWDEATDERAFTFNNTDLPNAFEVTSPGLIVTDEVRTLNEEAVSFLIANVTGGGTFAQRYEVEALKTGDTEYVNLGQASGGRFELPNVEDGANYTVRARSINSIGVRSAFTSVVHQVVGKTAPPSDVTNLSGNLIGNQYLLTWDAVPDADLSHYRIRFAAADGSPTYQNSLSLVPKVSRPGTSVLVPARNGVYFVKAVDKLGLASETPTSITLDSNIANVENLNNVTSLIEHPDFEGTVQDAVEIDEEDRLVLDTDLNFDGLTGNFDSAPGLFDGGGGHVEDFGYYYFDDQIDLGGVFMSRVTANIKSTRVDYVSLFDSPAGLFDDRSGLFDGDVNAHDDVDAQVEIRWTNDDPLSSPTWSNWQRFVVGDFKARAMEFRCKLSSTDNQATPAVSELSVQVDMADRTYSENDVASGAGAKVVTFPESFKEVPAIGIGAQDLQTGDFYEITAKSRTGFTITFKDSGGTAVNRTFDYVARGYGKEIA